MKAGYKLSLVVIAFVIVLIGFLVGVFAVSNEAINFVGYISFSADNVYAKVSGKVTGVKEKTEYQDITFTATKSGMTEAEIENWSKDLTFESATSIVEIEVTIENLSEERSLYVDVEGTIGLDENVNQAIKLNGETYQSETKERLLPSTGEGTSVIVFTIEMWLEDKELSVHQIDYEYSFNLSSYATSQGQVKTESEIDCRVEYPNYSYTAFEKATNASITDAYKYATTDGNSIVGYLGTNYDILQPIENGKEVTFTLYTSFMTFEVIVSVGGEEISVTTDTIGDYNTFSFSITLEKDTTIVFSGELTEL